MVVVLVGLTALLLVAMLPFLVVIARVHLGSITLVWNDNLNPKEQAKIALRYFQRKGVTCELPGEGGHPIFDLELRRGAKLALLSFRNREYKISDNYLRDFSRYNASRNRVERALIVVVPAIDVKRANLAAKPYQIAILHRTQFRDFCKLMLDDKADLRETLFQISGTAFFV